MDDVTKKNKKRKLMEKGGKGKKKQPGVCYLGRIPPRMDPSTLRQMLSQHGDIERVYLSPKDPSAHAHNIKPGKFQRQNFSEGWVEFSDKRVAKRVANMLNGEQIGGRKRSSFYYDLWNIKYLSKFKWDDLTEEIAFKKATREQKLALEISAAKREREFYRAKVDKFHGLNAIEERLKKRQKKAQEDAEKDQDDAEDVQEDSEKDQDDAEEVPVFPTVKKVIRRFKQKTPVTENASGIKPRLSKDVLAGVFGGS